MNFFVTIITESFQCVKENWDRQTNEYEIVEFVTQHIRDFFGCHGNDETRTLIELNGTIQYLEG